MLALPGESLAVVNDTYTLADLEILEKERAYPEFFKHAFDIRPSERSEYWKKMMENMGEGHLRALTQKTRLDHSDFVLMERLMGHSVLAQFEFFRQRRQEVALKWFQQCFKEDATASSPCWQDLLSFWEKDRQEIDLAPRLLMTVGPYLPTSKPDDQDSRQRARAEISEIFILAPMLKDSVAGSQCQKPEIRQVVWTEARRLWGTTLREQDYQAGLNSLAHASCWQSISQWARTLLMNGASIEELNMTYQLLTHLGTITPQERDIYLVSYALGTPARGDLFNLAWNRIQELGQRPTERDLVLARLKSWRPLPGHIFGDLDLAKRRAIGRHMKQNFPEYLDYYARTCIDFYGGKQRFPDGNPALSCREMFDLATTEKDLLPATMVEVFKQSLTL